MSKDYTIGIYIRLSMADEDTGTGNKAESDSIGNQRMLINRYLTTTRRFPNIRGLSSQMTAIPDKLSPASVFCDDGESPARRDQPDLRQRFFAFFS